MFEGISDMLRQFARTWYTDVIVHGLFVEKPQGGSPDVETNGTIDITYQNLIYHIMSSNHSTFNLSGGCFPICSSMIYKNDQHVYDF